PPTYPPTLYYINGIMTITKLIQKVRMKNNNI
ncbi:MAG: hypothetical protein ACI90V_000547, partial [Bacillariaceae sp.]